MFDGMTDIGADRFQKLVPQSGATFPANPLIGQLFVHATHGLCVRCHDNAWRRVLQPA